MFCNEMFSNRLYIDYENYIKSDHDIRKLSIVIIKQILLTHIKKLIIYGYL